jgi:hypothetical protein
MTWPYSLAWAPFAAAAVGLLLGALAGCASRVFESECIKRRRDLHIIYATHEQLWVEPVMICPGESFKLTP